MVTRCSFRIPLGRSGRDNSAQDVDPARLDLAKAIIDGICGVLHKSLQISHIRIKGTYLILAVAIRVVKSNNTDVEMDPMLQEIADSIKMDPMIREIIDCIKCAAAAMRANAHESKPMPLDKVPGLVPATKRLLRALTDGGRLGMQVEYVNDSITIGLPMPDASDFTDVVESHAESRRLDQPVCGYFSAGDNQDHMLVLRDRTFVAVPMGLEEVLEMARRKTTFAAIASRKSTKDDWTVGDEYRVPGELFPTHP